MCGRLARLSSSQIHEIYVPAGVSKIKADVMIKLCAAVCRASHPAERYRKQMIQFGEQRWSVVCFLSLYLCVHACVVVFSLETSFKGNIQQTPLKPFFFTCSALNENVDVSDNLFCTQTSVRDHQTTLSIVLQVRGLLSTAPRHSSDAHSLPPLGKTYVGVMGRNAVF